MNEMERIALEREFEDKSGRLTEMMLQMSDMQTAYRKWEAASRANAVMAAYEAMTAENDEVARMQKHVDRAAEESKNAASSGAKAAANAQQLALDLAKEKQASAKAAYEAALAENGFDSEEAFKAAFLTKPAFMKLDETVTPFRMEYATLLARCEEIEALLPEDEEK